MTYDEWMNVCAVAGVSGFLFSIWVITHGLCEPGALWNRALRYISVGLFLTPLGTTWHLSGGALFVVGGIVAAVAYYYVRQGFR